MTNPGVLGSVAKPPHKYAYIHLSLVYDTVRWNPNGRITEVDKALDVTHDDKDTFFSAHVGITLRQVCVHRKEEEDANKKKRKRQSLLKKRVRKVVGCNKHVCKAFWNRMLCYLHGFQENMMCVKCRKKRGQRAGRLCSGCFEGKSGQQKEHA